MSAISLREHYFFFFNYQGFRLRWRILRCDMLPSMVQNQPTFLFYLFARSTWTIDGAEKKNFFNACSYLLDYIIYITNASLSGVWFLILACFFKLSSCCKDFLSLFSFFFFFYRRLQVLQKHLGYFPWSVLFMIFKHKKKNKSQLEEGGVLTWNLQWL